MGLFTKRSTAQKISKYYDLLRTNEEAVTRGLHLETFRCCFGFIPRSEQGPPKLCWPRRFRNFFFDSIDLEVEKQQVVNTICDTVLKIRQLALAHDDPARDDYDQLGVMHDIQVEKFDRMRVSATVFYADLAHMEEIELPENLLVLTIRQDVSFVNQEQEDERSFANVTPLFQVQAAE